MAPRCYPCDPEISPGAGTATIEVEAVGHQQRVGQVTRHRPHILERPRSPHLRSWSAPSSSSTTRRTSATRGGRRSADGAVRAVKVRP